MKTPLVLAALSLAFASASPAAAAQENQRVAVVYGDDACPANKPDEIVVCARNPEGERFRIPERFRQKEIGPAAGNQSWAVRAEGLDAAGPRTGVNDCSVVGPGGWTGCFSSWLRSNRDDRRAARRANDALPGGGAAKVEVITDHDDEEEDQGQ